MLALGAAVILAAAPVAHPDAAQAASYQERMEALQKRKDILAEACALHALLHANCPASGPASAHLV